MQEKAHFGLSGDVDDDDSERVPKDHGPLLETKQT
jgi:hypothetical protein